MATRRASDSGTAGKKYNDGSAGGTKIGDVPNKPTINSVSGNINASIAFTAANTGGAAANYIALSTPGGFTKTGTTTPIDFQVADGLTQGSTYTFQVAGQTSNGVTGPYSTASSSFTIPVPVYALGGTFNSSGSYTTPAGATKIAVVACGSGGGGGGGAGPAGGGGGGCGAVAIFEEIPVSASTTYNLTIGSAGNGGGAGGWGQGSSPGGAGNAGGQTNISSFATFNGGSGGNGAAWYGPGVNGGSTGGNGSANRNTGNQSALSNTGGSVNTSNAQISGFTSGTAGSNTAPGGGGSGGVGGFNSWDGTHPPGGGAGGQTGRVYVYWK